MTGLVDDLRYAVRRLVRRPLFTLSIVSILALGMIASTAVFTYLNNFYRPLPGADADGLYQLFLSTEADPYRAISFPDYRDLATSDGVVSGAVAVYGGFGASVRLEDFAEVAFGEAGTGDYFGLLGIGVELGRALGPEDDTPGADATVVLAHDYWMRRYDGDPSAVGRTIRLNNEPYTIVGVARPDFLGSTSSRRPEFWIPFEQYKRVYWARSNREADREAGAVSVYVRLPRQIDAANEAMAAFASSLDREAPLEDGARRFRLEPATWIDPATRVAEIPTTRLWLAAAAGLLLLACANVGNLVLAASTRRGPEMALRAAIGGGSGRLLRQLLTESLLLSTLGGVVALALASPASRRIGSYFARPSVWGTNVSREVDPDVRVFAFVLVISILTGVLAGIVPAWRGSHRDLSASLRDGGSAGRTTGASGGGWLPTGDLLVSLQIGLSLVLLVVAGLVVRTLDAARSVDAGFDTDHAIATYVSTSSIGTPVEERHLFYDRLVEHFAALPWVASATVADYAPLSPHGPVTVRADGSDEAYPIAHAKVAAGYFEAIGVGLVDGRTFTVGDSVGSEPVAIVNRAMAQRAFGSERAVDRTLYWRQGDGPEAEELAVRVVGVVEDTRLQTLLGPPEPNVYLAFAQHYSAPGNSLVVTTVGDPAGAVDLVRRELRSVDPHIAIVNVLPYADVVDGFLYQQRMNAQLFALVALLGSVLACAGVFAITSLSVGRRRRELGIRMALGASRSEIVRVVTRRVARATAIGLLVGLAGAVVAGRLVAGLLYDVAPTDWLSFASGALLLGAAAALALAVPTRRALRLDPVRSLRTD